MSWGLLYILDALAIALFVLSYYRNCYRQGYRIDFWHEQLFLLCVLPNMLMLPFANNILNGLILGRDYTAVVAAIPDVFLLTMLGYISVIIGGSLWNLQLGAGIRSTTIRVLDIVPRCSMMLMRSRSILVFQTAICLLLQVLILGIYFAHNGFGFDLREYTFANPELRPIALVISGYSIIIASHCLARYIDLKERVLLICTLLLTIGMVFFGARSNILYIYLNVLICYLIRIRDRVSLLRIATLISAIIIIGLYLGKVRAGQYSLGDFFSVLVAALLFGNTFSDLRDFGWVYALWDHKFWIGKTYIAAITSFVPRFASEFRDTWGLGVATARTLGLDPHVHPGVRPGAFGEGYFNFGFFGVVGIGLLIGVVVRRIDIDVKRSLLPPHSSMRRAFASTMLITVVSAVSISAGFSGLYVLAGIYLFSWLCLLAQRMVRSPHITLADAS